MTLQSSSRACLHINSNEWLWYATWYHSAKGRDGHLAGTKRTQKSCHFSLWMLHISHLGPFRVHVESFLQGLPQLISNINACQAVADVIRTTLGPAGRDKLIATNKVTISNDGATIMRLLEISHPAAKTLVDISISQDVQVGDGTTSVVLLAAEVMTRLKPLLEEGLHPVLIMKQLRQISQLCVESIREMAVPCVERDMLINTASTALNSKLISNHKDLFAPQVVEAVQSLHKADLLDHMEQLIAVKQVPGGQVRQSRLVAGVAFAKTFSYAGFDQMKKTFDNPKILLLNVELELKAEKENAEVRISAPDQYQAIVDAEWQVIYDKLQACVDIGANVVLSRLPIGDLATQFFADRGLFAPVECRKPTLSVWRRQRGERFKRRHGVSPPVS